MTRKARGRGENAGARQFARPRVIAATTSNASRVSVGSDESKVMREREAWLRRPRPQIRNYALTR